MEKKSGQGKETNLQALIIILTALVLFFIFKMCAIDVLFIKGQSMEPEFQSGEFIFINKTAYGILIPFIDKYLIRWAHPGPGDIVLFKNPEEGKLVIKRCVAVSGDPVRVLEHVLIAGNRVIPYDHTDIDSFQFKSDTVPGKNIFVLGDNIAASVDSRHFGFVPYDSVYGKVITFGQ